MRTTARSRRVAMAVVSVALVVLLGLIVMHQLQTAGTARATATSTPSPAKTYARYTFSVLFPGDQTGDQTAHPGDVLHLVWQPQRDSNTQVPGPTLVTCSVSFYGPYATLDLGRRVEATLAGPAGLPGTPTVAPQQLTLAVAAPPLSFDDRSSTAQQETVRLPADLALGYYVFATRAADAFGGSTSEEIIQITHPAA